MLHGQGSHEKDTTEKIEVEEDTRELEDLVLLYQTQSLRGGDLLEKSLLTNVDRLAGGLGQPLEVLHPRNAESFEIALVDSEHYWTGIPYGPWRLEEEKHLADDTTWPKFVRVRLLGIPRDWTGEQVENILRSRFELELFPGTVRLRSEDRMFREHLSSYPSEISATVVVANNLQLWNVLFVGRTAKVDPRWQTTLLHPKGFSHAPPQVDFIRMAIRLEEPQYPTARYPSTGEVAVIVSTVTPVWMRSGISPPSVVERLEEENVMHFFLLLHLGGWDRQSVTNRLALVILSKKTQIEMASI